MPTPSFFFKLTCDLWHIYMSKQETPEEVRKWFLSQVGHLWPVAIGSLSLRRNQCTRKHCPTYESGEGHPSYALYIRSRKGRSVIYVPDDLAESLASALANGRLMKLKELPVPLQGTLFAISTSPLPCRVQVLSGCSGVSPGSIQGTMLPISSSCRSIHPDQHPGS